MPEEPVKHPRAGQFWLRRYKNGNTVLVGYMWFRHKPRGDLKTFIVKIKLNHEKPTPTAPDYIAYDYTKEKKDGSQQNPKP